MKQLAIKILSACARAVLQKYQPKIVAITGTVGKSSAKEAVYAVLSHALVVRKSKGNYNTEFGVPLTILGLSSPGKSPLRWLGVLLRALRLLFATDHSYPDVLVLEMAADAPGDIAALTAIARPHIAVITAITPVHLEKFGHIERVQKEKAAIWAALPANGVAIGNADDGRVMEEAKNVRCRLITYGLGSEADIRAGEKSVFQGAGEEVDEAIRGLTFKLYGDGSVLPVHLPGVLGAGHVLAALAGAAAGAAMGLNYHEIVEGLHSYRPLPGRMRVIPGIKHTLLIDDTYNASPSAVNNALEELRDLPIGEAKRFAVLGDMLELGSESEKLHQEAGRASAALGFDALVAVGERAADISVAAREAGMPEEKVFHFGSTGEAGRFIQERLNRGDAVLIKGSRGMRMEEIVRELMAEPDKADELLVH